MKWLSEFIAALACWAGEREHNPLRQEIGGFRCSACGKPGASFDDFDMPGSVNLERKLYSRDRV